MAPNPEDCLESIIFHKDKLNNNANPEDMTDLSQYCAVFDNSTFTVPIVNKIKQVYSIVKRLFVNDETVFNGKEIRFHTSKKTQREKYYTDWDDESPS